MTTEKPQPLSADAHQLLIVLGRHIGVAKGVTVVALCQELKASGHPVCERRVRTLVEELRNQGHHVCAHPKHGYFLAETMAELDETVSFLFRRGMASLRQIGAMRRVSVPDLAGQLRIPT